MMKRILPLLFLVSVLGHAEAQKTKKKVVKKPAKKAVAKVKAKPAVVDTAKVVYTDLKDTVSTKLIAVKDTVVAPVPATSTLGKIISGLGGLSSGTIGGNSSTNNGGGSTTNNTNNSGSSSLTNSDIVSGLKEALVKGAQNSSDKLSVVDGFFANAALKILMPPEAQKVETQLRAFGLGDQVDKAILTMNRAAEDASKSAAPIFINAVKSMNITDAIGILRGSDTSATSYLRGKTVSALTEAFRPTIEASLQKVDATKYWNTLFTAYNQFSSNKVNPDLVAYVTEKALSGIFVQLGQEEINFRKNPLSRTTDILKKVFGSL